MPTRRDDLMAIPATPWGLGIRRGKAEAAALFTYHMPVESSPHQRTFMQWPVGTEVYGPALLKREQASIALIAQTGGGVHCATQQQPVAES